MVINLESDNESDSENNDDDTMVIFIIFGYSEVKISKKKICLLHYFSVNSLISIFSDLFKEMAPKYTIFRHFSKVEKHDLLLT